MCIFTSNFMRNFYRSAPEVILDGRYTHASDVWALGIIAWELYTSFAIGKDRQELSLPFYDLEPKEVNFCNHYRQILAIIGCFLAPEGNVLM